MYMATVLLNEILEYAETVMKSKAYIQPVAGLFHCSHVSTKEQRVNIKAVIWGTSGSNYHLSDSVY